MTFISIILGIIIIILMMAIYGYVSTVTEGMYYLAKDAIEKKRTEED